MSNNFSKSAKNATVSIVCQIITLLMSFAVRSVFIKFLSVEYLGVSGLFSNILTILSFTELGIGHVMIYNLYEPLKKNDNGRIKALLNLYKKSYRYIALTILIIGIAITPFVQHLIKGTPDIPEDIRILFLLYLFNTVASYMCTYKKSVLLADQKTYITNIITTLSQFVLIGLQLLVLITIHSFIGYLICQIICTLSVNIILSIVVNKQYRTVVNADASDFPAEQKRKIFTDIKALAISKVSGIVSSGVDNIIISRMFGLIPVGLSLNYTLIINSVNNIFFNGFTSISSGIGNFNVDSTIERKRSIFDQIFLVVYFVYSFVCVCLLVLVQPFIRQWVGDSYLLSYPIVLNLVMGVYVGGVNYPVYSFRTTSGYFKEVKYVYVACAILNILLSIVFGLAFGVAGVYAATWISKFVLTEVADSYYTYKVILCRKHYQYFLKYFVFLALMLANAGACWFIIQLIHLDGWFALILKAVICGILNISINLAIFYRTKAFNEIVARIKSVMI